MGNTTMRMVGLVLVVGALMGCEHTTPLKYTATSAIDTLPPAAAKHRVLVAKFTDAREDKAVARIGLHSVNTSDDVGVCVAGAVADALRKAGLQVSLNTSLSPDGIGPQAVPADYDAVIVGKITQFKAKVDSGFSNVHCKGLVVIQYRVVSRNRDGGWSEEVKGESLTDAPMVGYSELSNFTDSALQRCMENFVRHLSANGAMEKL